MVLTKVKRGNGGSVTLNSVSDPVVSDTGEEDDMELEEEDELEEKEELEEEEELEVFISELLSLS